jgi:hypothetical protein
MSRKIDTEDFVANVRSIEGGTVYRLSAACDDGSGFFVAVNERGLTISPVFRLTPKKVRDLAALARSAPHGGGTLKPVTVESPDVRLAGEFSKRLKDALTYSQMIEVLKRNAKATGESVCASHDFIDANEVMNEAFFYALGRYPLMTDDDMQRPDADLWNAAWIRAKNARFYVEGGAQ